MFETMDYTGLELYNSISGRTWYSQTKSTRRESSALLKRAGIKGISYNGGVDGECNVTFDPTDIKVIKRETAADIRG